ncbi:MAG: hypothetical protein HYY24_22485 [Verrucomicrobia bacterium]|nr:hypothetical protein [Verrucomicrobiota bacterium]
MALAIGGGLALAAGPGRAASNVYLTEVPDYDWWFGCFGTACGNLMGYWDRHGLPEFYTGPTNGGLAPVHNYEFEGNHGIRALWASQAGFDGRPPDKPGHVDDYYDGYESTAPDPYVTAGRQEHEPDCIGDFIGLSQLKWKNMNGECDGNIDAYSFVYWDPQGERRTNFVPGPEAGLPAIDLPSGLRAWTRSRGYDGEVFSQLTDFNPGVPAGKGFTFEDLKAEIDAGYPVLLFLQPYGVKSRRLGALDKANPSIHGMLAYGYLIRDDGTKVVRYRTSWASGDNKFAVWNAQPWEVAIDLPVRGVIGYHPWPKIRHVDLTDGTLTLRWDGPSSVLYDAANRTSTRVHTYAVERATSLAKEDFIPIADPTTERQIILPDWSGSPAFFRVKLVKP